MRWLIGSLLVVGCLGAAMSTAQQSTFPREQPLILKTTVGSELYKFYCSNCHGLDAKGRAPTTAMQVAGPDLTTLAARNRGVFPHDRVEAIIKHGVTDMPSHGPKNMPVWGAIFRGLEPNDTMVEIRIANLITYLQSVQREGVTNRSRQ